MAVRDTSATRRMLCSLSGSVAQALFNGRQGFFCAPRPKRTSVTARSYLIDLCDLELHSADAPSVIKKQRRARTVSLCELQDQGLRDCSFGVQKQPTSFTCNNPVKSVALDLALSPTWATLCFGTPIHV
jgi:hypothetical protein